MFISTQDSFTLVSDVEDGDYETIFLIFLINNG